MQRKIRDNKILRGLAAWVFAPVALHLVLGKKFGDGLVELGIDPKHVVLTRTMYEEIFLEQVQDEPPKQQRPYILFMSRFDPEKGARELAQAFIALAQDYPDMDLVLAGDGIDGAAIHNIVDASAFSGRVIFTGYVGGADKWRLLRDCEIFALPTYFHKEGMPVAILEAMGAGKPLLLGVAGAIRDIAKDPDNGVVTDDVTPTGIEAGLRRLLSNRTEARAIGARNAAIAHATFEAAIVTASVENFYQKVAAC